MFISSGFIFFLFVSFCLWGGQEGGKGIATVNSCAMNIHVDIFNSFGYFPSSGMAGS